jgi:hypothetical protein
MRPAGRPTKKGETIFDLAFYLQKYYSCLLSYFLFYPQEIDQFRRKKA